MTTRRGFLGAMLGTPILARELLQAAEDQPTLRHARTPKCPSEYVELPDLKTCSNRWRPFLIIRKDNLEPSGHFYITAPTMKRRDRGYEFDLGRIFQGTVMNRRVICCLFDRASNPDKIMFFERGYRGCQFNEAVEWLTPRRRHGMWGVQLMLQIPNQKQLVILSFTSYTAREEMKKMIVEAKQHMVGNTFEFKLDHRRSAKFAYNVVTGRLV